MKNKILSSCVALLLFFSSCSIQGKSVHMEDEFRKIVKVYTNDLKADVLTILVASAVPIANDYLLTAGHFCEAVSNLVNNGELENSLLKIDYLGVGDDKQTLSGVEIVDFLHDNENDICLLRKQDHKLKKVKLSKYYNYLQFGNKVFTVGYPLGYFPATITDGYISSLYTTNYPGTPLNSKLMISSPIIGGNSGGAVFNASGELIGIAVMVNPDYHNIVFAVPLPKILEYLDNFK
jgi:S1-C subfamily serine protease